MDSPCPQHFGTFPGGLPHIQLKVTSQSRSGQEALALNQQENISNSFLFSSQGQKNLESLRGFPVSFTCSVTPWSTKRSLFSLQYMAYYTLEEEPKHSYHVCCETRWIIETSFFDWACSAIFGKVPSTKEEVCSEDSGVMWLLTKLIALKKERSSGRRVGDSGWGL